MSQVMFVVFIPCEENARRDSVVSSSSRTPSSASTGGSKINRHDEDSPSQSKASGSTKKEEDLCKPSTTAKTERGNLSISSSKANLATEDSPTEGTSRNAACVSTTKDSDHDVPAKSTQAKEPATKLDFGDTRDDTVSATTPLSSDCDPPSASTDQTELEDVSPDVTETIHLVAQPAVSNLVGKTEVNNKSSSLKPDKTRTESKIPGAESTKKLEEEESDGRNVETKPSKSDDGKEKKENSTEKTSDGTKEKKKKRESSETLDDESEYEDFLGGQWSLKELVETILEDLELTRAVWQKSKDTKYFQVMFECPGDQVETVLSRFRSVGVGQGNTSISVYPASLHYEGSYRSESDCEEDLEEVKEIEEVTAEINQKTSEFKKSIKARLVVDQVVESIRLNAEFTFDFLMLIILASLIASVGLAENSSVILVASMLISPLMGPILAGTFGTVIKNGDLRNTGIRSELIGLGICILTGFLFGLIPGAVNLKGAKWGSSDSWPTTEMSSRGWYRSLWVGILIALPSGAGVALSVLGGNAGSLVGVAISASLLPPAVNAGMLWGFAFLAAVDPPPRMGFPESSVVNVTNTTTNDTQTSGCLEFADNEYGPMMYSCSMALETLMLGLVSLLLTLLNIICIFFMGIFVLKIKEVAPNTSHSSSTKAFFQRDIKIARAAYATLKGPSSRQLGQKFLEEYKKMVGDNIDMEDDVNALEVRGIIEEVEQSDDVRGVIGRVPGKTLAKPISSAMRDIFAEAEASVYAKEELSPTPYSQYHTISGSQTPLFHVLRHRSSHIASPTSSHRPTSYHYTSQGRVVSSTHLTIGASDQSKRHSRGSTDLGENQPLSTVKEDANDVNIHDPKPRRRKSNLKLFIPSMHLSPHVHVFSPRHSGFVPAGFLRRSVHRESAEDPSGSSHQGEGQDKGKGKRTFKVTTVAESPQSKGVSGKVTRFNVESVPDDCAKGSITKVSGDQKTGKASKTAKDPAKESLLGTSDTSC